MNGRPALHRNLILLGMTWLVATVGQFARADDLAGRGRPWPRHVIDDSSRGADGVKLADVDGDGLLDVATGWEEGGLTRIYRHPGHAAVRGRWPMVTVGQTPNVEDAAFVDLDADGRTDVVTCCEGRTRKMFVHWGPRDPAKYFDESAWTTEPLPASEDLMMWMFAIAMEVDGLHGVDLVAGGKGADAAVGWFESPGNPRQLADWKWHPISPAGWVMSLRTWDVDSDGHADIVLTDRKGALRGCRWLRNPGPGDALYHPWKNHYVGGRASEVMFMTIADLDGDGVEEPVCAVRGGGLLWLKRPAADALRWEPAEIPMPLGTGTGKAVQVADVDRNGRADLVFSCENADGEKSGVMWLAPGDPLGASGWTAHEISGPAGIKFDRMELVDLDGDGDLDVMACEESQPVDGKRRGLGVFWYENPTAAEKTAR
jgi:hypothetical protein